MPARNCLNKWIYLSQAELQIAITITVCSFLGVWLDTKLPNDYSPCTVVYNLVEVIGTMYSTIRKAQRMTGES